MTGYAVVSVLREIKPKTTQRENSTEKSVKIVILENSIQNVS